jgi:hypothetical protein
MGFSPTVAQHGVNPLGGTVAADTAGGFAQAFAPMGSGGGGTPAYGTPGTPGAPRAMAGTMAMPGAPAPQAYGAGPVGTPPPGQRPVPMPYDPSAFGATQSAYGGAQGSYGGAPPGSPAAAAQAAPQGSYGAAQGAYGAAQGSYGAAQAAPQGSYGAAQGAYGATQGSYGAAQGSYGGAPGPQAAAPYGDPGGGAYGAEGMARYEQGTGEMDAPKTPMTPWLVPLAVIAGGSIPSVALGIVLGRALLGILLFVNIAIVGVIWGVIRANRRRS